jgi:hypothetical protein
MSAKPVSALIHGVDFSCTKSYTVVKVPSGAGCGHRGCGHHITHPCEKCGRIGAKGIAVLRKE